jgi:AcrR family transcriptional regulator
VSARAGGRPRDPELTGLVKTVTIELLAERRMDGLNGDAIARRAGVGKAAIYRRWSSLDELLVDVVRDLGVRDVTYMPGDPGTARDDLLLLLDQATDGPLARAEAAVLSTVGTSRQLAGAYAVGPYARFLSAADVARKRAEARGEPPWPAVDPILAAWALLMHQRAITHQEPGLVLIDDVVDHIALPALLGGTTP